MVGANWTESVILVNTFLLGETLGYKTSFSSLVVVSFSISLPTTFLPGTNTRRFVLKQSIEFV